MDEQTLTQAVIEELAAALAARLGGGGHVGTSAGSRPDPSGAWSVLITVRGAVDGSSTVSIPAEDARQIAARVIASPDSPPADAVSDCLSGIAGDAAHRLAAKLGAVGCRVDAGMPVLSETATGTEGTWVVLSARDLLVRVCVSSSLDQAGERLATPSDAAATTNGEAAVRSARVPPNLDLILDIELPLWVRFGETDMTLNALSKLGPGATLDLDRAPEDPVDLLINNTVVARGEVVVVAGNYGVRVTEVIGHVDRIRSMGSPDA